MSYAPQTLLDLRDYLKGETGLSDNELGIVGDANHTYGYHLGEDRLPKDDYSNRTARDIAGLTDAASASDIGMFDRLVAMTDYLVAEGRAGRATDIREIIGPAANGRAYRYDSLSGWKPQLRAAGDPHEWHTHVSWYRDSEFRDKTALFKRFFDGGDDMFEQADRNALGEMFNAMVALRDGNTNKQVKEYPGGMPVVGSQVSELHDRPPVESAPVDVAALAEALRPIIAEESDKAARAALAAYGTAGAAGVAPDGK